MNTLAEKLNRIKNHSTKYELILAKGDEKYLVVYTPRRTRTGIMAATPDRHQQLQRIIGSDLSEARFAPRSRDGVIIGEWRLYFTGRTQRDAYIEGELPFIGVDAQL